jgi:hypothetical protein
VKVANAARRVLEDQRVIGRSSTVSTLASFQHVERAVDEYMMSWSDAVRAETDFLESQPLPGPSEDVHQFGTLGRALWRERSLAWILRLNPAVRSEDARKIVEGLHEASKPLLASR